jgi:hypothetical protein
MYAVVDSIIGAPQLSMAIGQVNANPPLTPPGVFLTAVDPWWGAGEFIYARANGTIRPFGLCVVTPSFQTNAYRYDVTEVPNTANLGRMLAVSMQSMVAGDFGWFCIAGLTPVDCNASVAADTTFGIAAAGQGGANTAGKQVLNGRVMAAASATVAKANAQAASGSLQLIVPNSDGWFPGVFLSGTGIAALTRVVSISPDGRTATLSVATTAAVNGTVTATYNNATIFYNVAHLNRPFAQGAIT